MAALVASTPSVVIDSLVAYGLFSSSSETSQEDFFSNLYEDLLDSIAENKANVGTQIAPSQIRACQLCARSYIPLTAHHLIPRQVHAKAVKRGWVVDLNECQTRIAWICRACHSFVHRLAKNEELAKRWNTLEALEEDERVKRWVAWVGRVRWKKR